MRGEAYDGFRRFITGNQNDIRQSKPGGTHLHADLDTRPERGVVVAQVAINSAVHVCMLNLSYISLHNPAVNIVSIAIRQAGVQVFPDRHQCGVPIASFYSAARAVHSQPVALFAPRVAVHVVAIAFQEAALIAIQQFDAVHPFGALPGVK